jgi:hypothetical protein
MASRLFPLFLFFSSSSNRFSSSTPLKFYEPSPRYPSLSFHNISISDRHFYLNPSVSSIPCGYMIPTELDVFRFPPSSGVIPTATEEVFIPTNCTIMIVRLLFGAYEIFNPRARKYLKLAPNDRRGENLCYLLITDSLSIQHPQIAEHILANSSSPVSSFGYSPWHVFVIKNLIYTNPAKTMKAIKLSLFRLFPSAKFILYYDLKFQMKGSPLRFLQICNNIMENHNASHAIYRTGAENSIELEFIGARERLEFLHHSKGVVKNLTEEFNDIDRQQKQYQSEGFFEHMRKQRDNFLVDSAIIVFKNHNYEQLQHQKRQNDLHHFFCSWMNEVILYSRRDQLSYPYVEQKLQIFGFKIPPLLLLKFFQKIPHKYPLLQEKESE